MASPAAVTTRILVIVAVMVLAVNRISFGQLRDRLPTGYLADASEQFWPADTSKAPLHRIRHLPIFDGNGYLSSRISIREGFEYFRGYLWGMGPQDDNGYVLHRVLLHSDLRYSKHFRLFTELQTSLISGRIGGPAPYKT